MKPARRLWLISLVAALAVAGVIWFCVRLGETERAPVETPAPQIADSLVSTGSTGTESDQTTVVESAESAKFSPEERDKQVDRAHLRALRGSLLRYKQAHGHFPENLSQLVPDFVDASVLTSPRYEKDGVTKRAYGYEFSNVVFRDGRTFADIKEVQRAEWGDALPILRAWGYGKLINMSYGGDLYETGWTWEWDSATLDVVATRGWGPGLSEGQFTTVRVLGPDGQPVSGANVWAGGRRYSLDLPNRPFTTDPDGYAKIPLGTDVARTALALRVEGNGLASPVTTFPMGHPPESYEARVESAQTVGGKVLGADGRPAANTWIYLKQTGPTPMNDGAVPINAAQLGIVKTDLEGRWSASLHPKDAAAFSVVVGDGSRPPQSLAGESVDSAAALDGNAVTTLPSPAKGADGGGK